MLDPFGGQSWLFNNLKIKLNKEVKIMSKTEEIKIVWNYGDVEGIAEDIGEEFSDDEIGDVLNEMIRNHDAELGITWDTVKCAIDNAIKNRPEVSEVIIEVHGGIAYVSKNTNNIKVTIIDHDISVDCMPT